MRRNTVGIVAAVVIAAIATAVLVAYVRGAKDRAVAGEKLVDVLVASKSISAGTAAENLPDATKTERVPVKVQADGALHSLNAVQGLVTSTDLVAGEVLLEERFVSPGQVTKGVGEVKIPAGFVEITLSLEPQRAVGGLIRPGDKVAAYGSNASASSGTGEVAPTSLIQHQVLVSNVQIEDKANEPSAEDKTVAPTVNLLITLAVDDSTAEQILFYAEHGKVWLGAEQNTAATNSAGTAQ